MELSDFANVQQKEKNALVFERRKYQYQQYISDLNGVDIKALENNPEKIIKAIRVWLHTSSARKTITSTQLIIREYVEFTK